MKKLLCYLIVLQFMVSCQIAADRTIIEKDTNEPVMAATVRVMLLPDSSMVDGMYTDTVGVFRLVVLTVAVIAIALTDVGFFCLRCRHQCSGAYCRCQNYLNHSQM